jgi:hypothetical protein
LDDGRTGRFRLGSGKSFYAPLYEYIRLDDSLGRWKYILNLHPEFNTTHITEIAGEDGNYWHSWVQKAQHDADAATKVHRYQERPREELYDVINDPLEQHNLADAPACAETLVKMRGSFGWRVLEWHRMMGRTFSPYVFYPALLGAFAPVWYEDAPLALTNVHLTGLDTRRGSRNTYIP